MKAILTGHTRGLGAAIAANLLARKIPVLGLARGSLPDADLLVQRELDLADPAALLAWLAGPELGAFIAGCKTVLLINNAGTVQPVGPLALQNGAAIARAVSLNVTAPLLLANALELACPQAAERRILHVSSGAGRSAYPGWSVYCATKAALDMHASAVQLDQSTNLKICSLAPGIIDTDMQAEIRASSLAQFPLRERFEQLKHDGALASAADCAQGLVDYLLSPGFGALAVADVREV